MKDINNLNSYLENEYVPVTFSDMLMQYMRDKQLGSKEIYQRCYVDRKLLHKILNNPEYHPSKKTAFALCVALRLTFMESVEFIAAANYTLRIYDLDTINEFLFAFQFPCMGE